MTNRPSGFVWLELLAALAITAALSLLAIPALQTLQHRSQLDNISLELLHAIRSARSTAVSRSTIVSLCPIALPHNGSCGDRWGAGFMLFTDTNNNGEIDSDDQLLDQRTLALPSLMIDWRASAGRNYLRYSPNGTARQFGRFHLCDRRGEVLRATALVINRQGRVRRYLDRDGDGVAEDFDGSPPDCPAN